MKLVICEKPSQSRNMEAALADARSRYIVLPAQGHLYRLAEPHEVNDAWKSWTDDVLAPESGFYPKRPDTAGNNGKAPRLARLRDALKQATEVIIACDCDREGQAIGEDIVRENRYRGPVRRAMFTSEDASTLRKAVEHAKDNSEYQSLFEAAEARRQADQIYNLTLTRVISRNLRPAGWKDRKPLGIGRVKTPTFAIVCQRELEIRDFKSRAYYEVWARLAAAGQTYRLTHVTTPETRIFDNGGAAQLARAADGWHGPVTCKTEPKVQAPEKPMDLPTLQKRASAWGWTAKKTLDVAQKLYETHKITTYPRAETRYLPEVMGGDAETLRAALAPFYHPAVAGWETTIRTGKKGVFSDAGIGSASHHAIIPNINVAGNFSIIYSALDDDERKLFDLIARTYLAAIGPDHRYDLTTVSIAVPFDGREELFRTTGRTVIAPGWKLLFGINDEPEEDEAEIADSRSIPAIPNGSAGDVTNVGIDEKQTQPPARYTEGSLIDAMQNAWRFLPEGEERERLKEAKGIGTVATRDTIIDGLKRQGWLLVSKKHFVPSDEAIEIYKLLRDKTPALVDPGFTAKMEMRLDDVLDGKLSAADVIRQITRVAERIVQIVLEAAPPNTASSSDDTPGSRPPSDKMLAAARSIAARKGIPLPDGIEADFTACKAFLDEHMAAKPNGSGDATPMAVSEKSLAFARKIAERIGKSIPGAALKDQRKLSAWIDANKGKRK